MERSSRRSRAEGRLAARVSRLREAARAAEARVEGLRLPADPGRSVFLGFEPCPRPALLSLAAPEVRAGGAVVLRDVQVRLGRTDRVQLQGANGSGKSTLLGALVARAGLPRDRLLFLPQEPGPGAGAALAAEVRTLAPEARGRVLSLVAALGAEPARLLATPQPSPGEARKLHLALGLGRHAWGLVLDEPTNHLDLPTVERLEAALAAYPGALLLVCHDAAFAARCTRGAWRIREGRVEEG
jgi:ATPase subunit of ABC transporter with duplicated ATPase domains